MRKIFNKLLLLILCVCFITGGVSCKKKQDNSTPADAVKYDTRENHYADVTVAENKFVMKGAKTDYKVVIPANASGGIRYAASEFNEFIKKSTKTEFTVISDEGLTYSDDAKYISLGETSLKKAAGVEYGENELKTQGYIIKTKGNSVFVSGPSDNSVLYGVYDLLNLFVDYKCYGDKNCYVQSNVSVIPFMNITVRENPDFDYRIPGTGLVINSAETANRLRMQATRESIPINGALGHTSLSFVPKSKYLNENDQANYHPDWYMDSENPQQLCYTARGNKDSWSAMIDAALAELKGAIKDSPNSVVNFSLSDSYAWCNCDACNADKTKYGTISSSVIKFLNELDKRTYAWFETEDGKPYKRNLIFEFYAYQQLETAPVTYNAESDTYTVIADEVRCGEHVAPQLCLTVANYTQKLDSEKNKNALNNIKSWAACANFTMSYMYSQCYKNFLIPYDTFSAVADWYQTYYKYNCIYAYTLSQHTETGTPTGWTNLKTFIEAELSWDCYKNVNDLIDDYFDKTFREAGSIIKGVFNEYRALSEYNEKYQKGYVTGVINQGNFKVEKFWPKNLLEKWSGDIEQAFTAAENIKSYDQGAYDIAYRYLRAERVWVNYLYYSLYGSTIGDKITELKSVLLGDLNYCGNICITENGGSIKNLLEELAA